MYLQSLFLCNYRLSPPTHPPQNLVDNITVNKNTPFLHCHGMLYTYESIGCWSSFCLHAGNIIIIMLPIM